MQTESEHTVESACTSNEQTTSGLILAGGAGRRVGGRDKGLLLWNDLPLVAHVAKRLGPQVNELFISCNRHRDRYQTFATLTAKDMRDNYQGPLAGLEAAVTSIVTPLLVVVPCDTPSLPADLVRRLTEPLIVEKALEATYAHDGTHPHYLCAAIKTDSLQGLTELLDQGVRAVRHWYTHMSVEPVDFSDQPEAFQNINTMPPQRG